jgi:hypothetical protein
MKIYTAYLYCFANFSLTLKIIEYLRHYYQTILQSVAVINLVNGWLIKINLKSYISLESAKNLQAILDEMGIPFEPPPQIAKALTRLEAGDSPTEIMNRYQIVIVTYGKPEKEEIELFRQAILERLGYCPQNMA